ncbi:MAG TPA: phage major tail tube protein, partial [Oligoflexus sp.]|uniref:phage major tail tube protein n=1 Tax=Oligoflexus sp. TaxID=1971216 RepID=UPI002D726AF7
TLPKIKIKTEEFQASTMHGPVEVGVSLEKLESTIKLLEIPSEILLATGFSVGGNVTTLVTGARQRQGSDAEPMTAIMQGWIKGLDFGTWKAGDIKAANLTIEMSVYRYSFKLEDVPLINIDLENGIQFISGVDYGDSVRKALRV